MVLNKGGGLFKSANTVYTYYKNLGGWSDGVSPQAVDDVALIEVGDGYLLRLPRDSSDVELIISGAVPMLADRKLIVMEGNNEGTDRAFSIASPVPVAIGDAGLDLKDQVVVFAYDNMATGLFKSASVVLTYYQSLDGWSDGVSSESVSDTYFLQPGQSYVLRVPGEAQSGVFETQTVPTYLQ